MTESTCSVRASALRKLLRGVSVASDRWDGYPGLTGVLLHTDTNEDGARVLVATASDRFILAQANADADGELDGPVFVRIKQVKSLVRLLDRVSGEALITVSVGTVTVKADDFTLSFESYECSLPRNAAEFLQQRPALDVPVLFAPWVVKRLAKIGKRMESDAIRVFLTGERRAAIAHIGTRCRVLVMPILRDEMGDPAPVFDPFVSPTPEAGVA